MNIIEVQESLKDLPDNALMQEMQNPTGSAPQFLVLSELKRRKRMRDDYQRRQAGEVKTVAEEAVTAAGAPQEGIMQISRAMNPNSSIAQNTGMDQAMPQEPVQAPQMMADGGLIKMQAGGSPNVSSILNLIRSGAPISDLIDIFGLDAVREAQSMALPPIAGSINPRAPTGQTTSFSERDMRRMEDQGIFGNSPGRNVGGEGIASVATSVEDFIMQPYERGTGRATMVDGTFVEVMPDGNVFDAKTGKMVTGDLAQKAIAKLSPDLTGDTAAFTEFAGTPSMYRSEAGMPTQEDLDLKAVSDARNEAVGIGTSDQGIASLSADVSDFSPAAISPVSTSRAVPSLGMGDGPSPIEQMQLSQSMREMASDSKPDSASIFNTLEGVVSGKTPNEKANEFLEYFQGLKTPDEENPMVSMISSALEGPTGTEEMAEFLENENFRFGSNADRFDSLGFTPITGEDGTQRFISPAGMVYDESGKLVSGGEAMQAMDIAQNQGADFSKSPMGSLPLGSYDTDESGNVIPDSFSPLSIPIGVSEGPEFLEGTLGPESTIGNLLGVQEAPVDLEDSDVEREGYISAQEQADNAELLSGLSLGSLSDPDAKGALSFGDLLPKDTDTSTTPAGRKSTSTSGGTGGGVGGRIAQMLADREKSAEADKWMALAQAGMALMASDQPTFGGALGEAGLVGVGAMQKARKQYDADIMDLLTLQQRANAASSRKSGGLTASNMISLVRNLQSYKGDIQDRIDDLNDLSKIGTMSDEERAAQLQRLQAEIMRTDFQIGTYMNALSGGGTGGSSFDVRGGSQSQGGVGLSLGTPTS